MATDLPTRGSRWNMGSALQTMRPFFLQRLGGLAAISVVLGGQALAQSWPEDVPSDAIFDDTRALTQEPHRKLAAGIADFERTTGIRFMVAAVTQGVSEKTPRTQARELRRRWADDTPALLLLFSRGSDTASISVSPHLWHRYPSADLIAALQRAGETLSDRETVLEERLVGSSLALMNRISQLEGGRATRGPLLNPFEIRMAIVFGAGLTVMAVIAALAAWRFRKTERQRTTLHFPTAAMPPRLGGAFGGEVMATSPHRPGE